MGLLETLGLKQKKARPVDGNLETGREQEPSQARYWLVKAGLFVGLLVLTLLAFPRGNRYEYTVEQGDAWRRDRLVAPFNFPVYKAEDSLAAERERVRKDTPPFFHEVPDAQRRMRANRDTLRRQLERVFDVYASYRRNKMRGRVGRAAEDSLEYLRRRRATQLTASPQQWQRLTRAYTERIAGLSSTTRRLPTGPRLDEELLDAVTNVGETLLDRGVMNVSKDELSTNEIVLRDEEERTDQARQADALYGLNEAYDYAQSVFQEQFSEDPEKARLASAFFRALFQPSLEYMRAETQRAREEKQARISPTRGVLQEGEVVVRKGQRIDEETRLRLTSLERALNERSGPDILWQRLGGELILTLLTFLLFFSYLFFLRRPLFDSDRMLLLMGLLFASIIALFGVVLRLPVVSLYAVPVAMASVHFTILFDSRIGLWGTLVLALLGGQILGFDLEYTLATLVAGTLGVFSVRDIKNRGQYFLSLGLVFLGYAVTLTGTWLYFGTPVSRLYGNLGFAVANALCVVLGYPLLWVFERGFGVTTDLTLLELSDTNRPVLKELSLRAPGTFNHTLQVANLAEAAANAIGAHALLTRVGALYHDIGKMLMPTYYVENQRTGDNPHDRLKPRMSALIIASHVKEGLEMGREHGLPRRVLDFIPMHHGTSRIEFFYRKAVERTDEKEPEVLESEFRYPGPRPGSREAGILMLADGVEAASRSLDKPTHKKLEALIDSIFRARADDGQLDDTALTFRDLRTIKETFLSTLSGIYHVRVKYPDQEKEMEKAEEGQEATPRAGKPAASGDGAPDEQEQFWGTPEQGVEMQRHRERTDDAEDRANAEDRAQRGASTEDAPSNGATDSAAREQEQQKPEGESS